MEKLRIKTIHANRQYYKLIFLSIALPLFFSGALFLNSYKSYDSMSSGGSVLAGVSDRITITHKRSILQDDNDTDMPECDASAVADSPDPCQALQNCTYDGRVNYLYIHYCTLKDAQWFSYIFLVSMLLYFFYLLGSTADKFFIPTLSRISMGLKLSPSIAGVTLLAFGNGAPDIFSNLSNINGDFYEQSLGQLTGACLFVTGVVLGSVALASDSTTPRRPFLRDIGFLTIGYTAVFVFCYDYKIELWEALSLVGIYVLFVLTVVVGRILYQRYKLKKQNKDVEKAQERLLAIGQTLPVNHPIFDMDINNLAGSTFEEKVNYVNRVVEAIEKNDLETLDEETPGDAEFKHKALKEILRHVDVAYLRHVGFWDGKKYHKKGKHGNSNNNASSSGGTSTYKKVESTSEMTSVLDGNKENENTLMDDTDDNENMPVSSNVPPMYSINTPIEDSDNGMEDDLRVIYDEPVMTSSIFNEALEYFEWTEMTKFQKIAFLLDFPRNFIQHLTIYWAEDDKYFKPLIVVMPPSIVLLVFALYNLWQAKVVDSLGNVIYWVLPISLALSIAIYFTSKRESPPVYEPIFLLSGMVMSVLWIANIAEELVHVLSALGAAVGISEGIMGLTVLAWGNSIGDFVSNVMIARKGFPEMAIGASYSAPLTNTMIGLGLAFAIKIISQGAPIQFQLYGSSPDLTNTIYFSFCFVLAQLLITMVVVPLSGFRFPRWFGVALILFYFASIIVSILALLGFILPDTNLWLF
eukprot:TRINITY_DN821_c0_g1_i1.p1 TRINITY_DN821_c0_g1~~TRINITY_DN821_c0_g1_i1.p1  ORF type:complete len:789 (-),score=139.13 TRINITY_DN821_c0_g1_i1:132-2387(-)